MSSLVSEGRIVNMGQEAFNDALKYVKEARECLASNRYHGMWSAARAAMFSMCLSAESDLSKLIALSLRRIGDTNWTGVQTEIYENLTAYSKENEYPPDEIKTIGKKYKQLLLINGYNEAPLPDGYWDAAKLRNKITHYSFSKQHSVYSMSIVDDIVVSLNEIRNFILHIWSIADQGTPHWIHASEYKELDELDASNETHVNRTIRRVRKI
ncbi:hypothetical protein PAEVO_52540 [Paenibacillus sp. GM2FR]|uniref:hypothetical protein n=1 Tax=Paenibacillus sp. GM2FR TaxID=2059268 RepID=UPI000CBA2079|nr:hypothetical protein [Paenibacillus sp. GM2FR]PJN50210.1 hypothetical protein PAEVO_52540 [Paenibacillus sp. GM2FR]